MTYADTHHAHAVSLFRYRLIADLEQLPPGSKGLYARMAQKAASDYTIPGSTCSRSLPTAGALPSSTSDRC